MSKLIDEIMAAERGKTDRYGLIAINWVHGILKRRLADLDPDRKLRELMIAISPFQQYSGLDIRGKISAMLEPEAEPLANTDSSDPLPVEKDLKARIDKLEKRAEGNEVRRSVLELQVQDMQKCIGELEQAVNQHAKKVGGAE